MRDQPELIAHRGLMARFPENTLRALREAVIAGAQHVEFDVQLTADGVPILFHDDTLQRTSGQAGALLDLTAAQVAALSVHEPARFGERFAGECVPTLTQAVALLNDSPAVGAFVELKRHSLARHGSDLVLERVLDALRDARFSWALISFESEPLARARTRHGAPIGWVLRAYDEAHRVQADALAPDYLFCNYEKLPATEEPLWPGPWAWALYDTVSATVARELQRRGAGLIETADVAALREGLSDG